MLSRLKDLLEIVGLEVKAEGLSAATFQIVVAEMLKLWASNICIHCSQWYSDTYLSITALYCKLTMLHFRY